METPMIRASKPAILPAATVCLLLAAACSKPLSVERQQLRAQWGRMRSGIVQQLAEEAYHAGDLELAEQKLRPIVDGDGATRDAKLLLARVYLEKDDPGRALETLASESDNDADVAYVRGLACELSRDYAAAAGHYEHAMRAKSDHFPYVSAAVEAHIAAGSPQNAAKLIYDLDARQASTPQWLALRAEVASANAEPDQALGLYRRALALADRTAPQLSESLSLLLAETLCALDRPADALAVVNQRTPGGDPQLDAALRRINVRASLAAGLTDGVADMLDQLDESPDQLQDSWLTLARIQMDQSNWPGARRALDRATAIDPTGADALMLKSLLEWRTGRRNATRVALQQWQSTHPDDPMLDRFRDTLTPQQSTKPKVDLSNHSGPAAQ